MNRETIEALLKRLSKALDTLDVLQCNLVQEKVECLEVATGAKELLDNHNETRKALNELQLASQQTQIKGIEGLLTTVAQLVFDDFEDKVRLELSVYRNNPACEFYMESKSGAREELISNRGGSLANVLAAAIPFIGLSRSTNRPFIVLDEPDCWIEPALICRFFRMLAELSYKLKMQVVVITHHDPAMFSEYADVVTLSAIDDGHVSVDYNKAGNDLGDMSVSKIVGERTQADVEGMGIQHLSFTDVGKVKRCEFDLSPNMTVVRGANELGKSNLFRCLKNVMYGKDARGYISHEAESAKVEVGLEGGINLFARITQDTKLPDYEVEIAGEMHRYSAGDNVLHEMLGIYELQERDLHFPHQLSPLGVLSPDISKTQRAKMLTLDPVSQRVTSMIEQYNVNYSEARKTLKDTDQKQDAIERELVVLSKYASLAEMYETIHKKHQRLTSLVDEWNDCRELGGEIRKLSLVSTIIDSIPSIDSQGRSFDGQIGDLLILDELTGLVMVRDTYWECRKKVNRELLKDNQLRERVDEFVENGPAAVEEIALLEKATTLVDSLEDIEKGEDLSKEAEDVTLIQDYLSAYSSSRQYESFTELDYPDFSVDTGDVEVLEEFLCLTGTTSDLTSELDETEQSLEDNERELSEIMDLTGSVCGSCYQEIDDEAAERIIKRAVCHV